MLMSEFLRILEFGPKFQIQIISLTLVIINWNCGSVCTLMNDKKEWSIAYKVVGPSLLVFSDLKQNA